jgi:hypothetical protein
VASAVTTAVSGDGQWRPVGPTSSGTSGMYESQFVPDDRYPYQTASAVWIDPRLLRVTLVPGLSEPGGTWPQPAEVMPAQFSSIAAAFNGGFKIQDAEGGFFLNGRIAVPLRSGAASLVLYSDGALDIGTWGGDVAMTPGVVAVLQNLVPLVEGGQVAASATYYDDRVWGATLGGGAAVARSGLGITASGALVYVAGPALSARTLGEALQRAGAVRAMELDMNPEWVTFNFFDHPSVRDPSDLAATKLYPQMVRPATRYLAPAMDSRDFLTVMLPS